MKIKLSPLCAGMIAFSLVIDKSCRALLFLCALLFHELAHIAAIRLFRGGIKEIRLGVLGAQIIERDRVKDGYAQKLIISLCAPAANFALAAISLLFSGDPFALYFCACNLSLGIFNILPIYENDGGEALYSFLFLLSDAGLIKEEKVQPIAAAADSFFLVVLWAFSVCAMLTFSGNLSFAAMTVFCFSKTFAQNNEI